MNNTTQLPDKPPLYSERGFDALTLMAGGATPKNADEVLRTISHFELALVEAKQAEDKAYWACRWRTNEHYLADKNTGATDKTAAIQAEQHTKPLKEEHLQCVGERRMLEASLSVLKRWHNATANTNGASNS